MSHPKWRPADGSGSPLSYGPGAGRSRVAESVSSGVSRSAHLAPGSWAWAWRPAGSMLTCLFGTVFFSPYLTASPTSVVVFRLPCHRCARGGVYAQFHTCCGAGGARACRFCCAVGCSPSQPSALLPRTPPPPTAAPPRPPFITARDGSAPGPEVCCPPPCPWAPRVSAPGVG